jgi:hypothetical protein
MKRFGLAMALMLGLFIVPSMAHAICTCVQVSTTSVKVLAANDLGSGGRKILLLNNGGTSVAYCDVGNSAGATAQQGFVVAPGGPPVVVPAAQYPPKTFPMTPNGEVDCVVQANQSTTNASVCACDN